MNETVYIKRKLINWQKDNYRRYPWRETNDPYKIMIAEFMLHRTRADQVVSVYEKFIEQYPDVCSLSCAEAEEIRKVTECLGLHWRSGHFIKAANFILEGYNGVFPNTGGELLKIPGVGEYIAGAILTICFNKKYPVVDSNIARFINRFYNLRLEGEIRRKKEIVNRAGWLFNLKNPGKFLFAIIDFTSLICKTRLPNHQICPLKKYCNYFKIHQPVTEFYES